ncbi:MAG: hypothetical protein ACKVU1_16000 [bacterium]
MKRPALALFFFLFFTYFLFSAGAAPKGDAYLPLTAAIELVQGKGILETRSMPGLAFLLVPIAFVANTVISGLFADESRWVALIWIANLFPALVTAGTATALFRIARALGHAPRLALFAALVFAFATPAAVYAKNIFPQPAEAFFLTLAIWGLVAARARAAAYAAPADGAAAPRGALLASKPLILSGLAFGALLLVKLVALAALPAFAFFVWRAERDGRGLARLVRWASPICVLALLYLPYNAAAHGGAFNFGYADGRDAYWGFATPLLIGAYGLLLSPGKGLFFYAPILVIAIAGGVRLARRDRALATLLLGAAAGWFVVHAKWWAWHADHAWGPRYLVPLLPIATLLVAEALRAFRPRRDARTLLLAALVLMSAGIQAMGASYAVDAYQVLTYDTVIPRYDAALGAAGPRDDEIHVHMIPEFSPLVGHVWLLRHALRGDGADAYRSDYPWRALRPDGAWEPLVTDPPRVDYWLTRFPRNYPSRRGVVRLVAALCVAGAAASVALLVRAMGAARSTGDPSTPAAPGAPAASAESATAARPVA